MGFHRPQLGELPLCKIHLGSIATNILYHANICSDGSQMNIAKGKLAQLETVKSHSGVVNSYELLKK